MSELKEKVKDDPDTRLLLIMLVLCFVLIAAIVALNIINAPKFSEPVFVADSDIETSAESGGISATQSSYISSVSSSEIAVEFPLKINTATIDELQAIPGIGPVTAQKIIDYRSANGTIVDFNELMDIDGIGEKTVETIAEYCVID